MNSIQIRNAEQEVRLNTERLERAMDRLESQVEGSINKVRQMNASIRRPFQVMKALPSNIKSTVKARPWPYIGGAVALLGGLILAYVVQARRRRQQEEHVQWDAQNQRVAKAVDRVNIAA